MRLKIQSIVVALLAMVLLTCPGLAASAFPDVNGNAEYAEAVEYVNEAGIMVGDNQGNFNPNKAVTRAEMATIICRMVSETENLQNSTVFTDVPVGHWANAYVGKAAELGVVNGYGNGKFGPSDPVTYEQAVKMVISILGGERLAQQAGGYPNGYLQVAEEHGLLTGVTAKRGDSLTRGNIAFLLYNSANFSFESDFDNAQLD